MRNILYLFLTLPVLLSCNRKVGVPQGDLSASNQYVVLMAGIPIFSDPNAIFYTLRNPVVDSFGVHQYWNGCLEFVSYADMPIQVTDIIAVLDSVSGKYYEFAEFRTSVYPGTLYIDNRRVFDPQYAFTFIRRQPGLKEVIAGCKSMLGTAYGWGGNGTRDYCLQNDYGIDGCFEGVDCSGYFNHVLNRDERLNTSDWLGEGEPVPVAAITIDGVKDALFQKVNGKKRALFIVVWRYHMFGIILNDGDWYTTESTWDQSFGSGVIEMDLDDRLIVLFNEQKVLPAMDSQTWSQEQFVIRLLASE